MAALRIEFARVNLGDRGARYRVAFRGETLVESSGHPEFDACRALLSRGHTGPLEVWWAGAAHPAMRLHIEKAAKVTSRDGDRDGVAIVAWQPFSAPATAGGPPLRQLSAH